MTQTLTELFAQNGIHDPDTIAQAGVIGMKWGVRKERKGGGSSSSSSESSKPKPKGGGESGSGAGSSAPKHNPIDNINNKNSSSKASKDNRNHLSTLSDKDLKDAIARVKMEQEFMQLTKPPPSKLAIGGRIVGEILLNAGKQQAQAYVTKELGKLIGDLDAKAKGKAEAANDAAKEAPKAKTKPDAKPTYPNAPPRMPPPPSSSGSRPKTQNFKFKDRSKTPKSKPSSAGNFSYTTKKAAPPKRLEIER